ncbi:MAG: four helix bundle protein [Patescibacteria group bacterium]
MEFCRRYVDYKSRTKDQMEQAARSGKQNIPEGYSQGNFQGKLKLLKVARGSQEELLTDYLDFLRQKGLPLWGKDDPKAGKVRSFVYKIKDYKSYNDHKDYNGYKSYNDFYNLYKPYLDNSEEAANAMICLINQTNAMMNQKIKWLEESPPKEGSSSPREQWLGRQIKRDALKERNLDGEVEQAMAGMGYEKLPTGQYVKKKEL